MECLSIFLAFRKAEELEWAIWADKKAAERRLRCRQSKYPYCMRNRDQELNFVFGVVRMTLEKVGGMT